MNNFRDALRKLYIIHHSSPIAHGATPHARVAQGVAPRSEAVRLSALQG